MLQDGETLIFVNWLLNCVRVALGELWVVGKRVCVCAIKVTKNRVDIVY